MKSIDEAKSIDSPSELNTNSRSAQMWNKLHMQNTLSPHWNNGKLFQKHSDLWQGLLEV